MKSLFAWLNPFACVGPLTKPHPFWKSLVLLSSMVLVAGTIPLTAQDITANEGGDLAFGGAGTEAGKFLELRDITFDARGTLYTLDGTRINNQTKAREGNLRVQKFDRTGKLLGTIDLSDAATGETLGDKNDPQRLAADAAGNVYVTQPAADRVQQFGPDGRWVRSYIVPRAKVITVWSRGGQERIAVVPSRQEVVQGKGWTWLEGDKIVILAPGGGIESTIALPQSLQNVVDVTTDRAGNFYIQAEPNAIYKFAPDGKLLRTFGGNPTTRNPDGSEVLHTVAVDSKGNVYTFAWGNPGMVTRFDVDGTTVTQREGQFKWADPWSIHSGYTILAMDPEDRLWVGVTNRHAPDYVHLKTQRAVPAIVRTKADYFTEPANAVKRTPVRMLGFRPEVRSALPFNIAYEPKAPVPMEFSVAAANRYVNSVTVDWHAFDALKNEVAKGRFDVPLENGKAAKTTFAFVPPRYGSYFVHLQMLAGNQSMGAVGEQIGVTPRFANMPVLQEGDSKGGWEDAPRHAWTGLPNMRLHPGKSLDKLDNDLATAQKYGNTVLVQIIDNQKHFKPEEVRAMMERFKGRIKYIEVCNEPNFSGSIEEYFNIHKQTYQIVKGIDPQVQVMGPATVNIDLNWLRRLYELGLKDVTDIISLHDYEGHESISPEHWTWKFGEVRKIMTQYGDGNKPIWQTERAIAGVRGNNFQGLVQAIRTTLHRDLLETLGISSEHNNHYYLNQGGYSDVPTYVWSDTGPMPAALALRTRHAVTTALNRRYAGKLDFGPTGNELFSGVRYSGTDGETIVLRNLGTRSLPLDFDVRGTTLVEVTDAWGNVMRMPTQRGKAPLKLDQLPIYVRLPRGASMSAPRIDFGTNLAPRAKFSYSSTFKGEFELLSNGVIETYHAGNPNGDTNGAKIWTGDLPGDLKTNPQTLDIRFDQPQTVNRILLRGVRADNAFCALLDYDLQYQAGNTWKTIESVRRPMPPSEAARTADATHAIWMDDTNFFMHQFGAVTTSRLRLVVRNVTHGFVPDDRARAWSNQIPQKFMLREIGIYGPSLPVRSSSIPVPVQRATRSGQTTVTGR